MGLYICEKLVGKDATEAIRKRMKRMGQPQEVADVALWLCSDQSTFITGHAVAVDGGALA